MRLYLRLFLIIVIGCGIVSCSEKKQDKTIITQKPKPVKKKATQSMSDYEQSIPIEWVGSVYHVNVSRQADSSLPLADDGAGNKYYDNKIKLSIVRKDQSEFYSRTFTKADFVNYVDELYRKNSALLGIVFDKVEGNNLIFAVSIGSPDKMSDEYVPLVMRISNLGAVSILKDTLLDTGNTEGEESEADMEEEDDGV